MQIKKKEEIDTYSAGSSRETIQACWGVIGDLPGHTWAASLSLRHCRTVFMVLLKPARKHPVTAGPRNLCPHDRQRGIFSTNSAQNQPFQPNRIPEIPSPYTATETAPQSADSAQAHK